MTMVDNGGITRVKAVPVSRLERVASNGVGMAYIWAAAGTDDLFADVPPFDNPSGDMRLIPDLTAARVLTAAPGWAWAPVDQMSQELEPVPACQRHVLSETVEAARSAGVDLRATFEIEATLLDAAGRPAHAGPGYSTSALALIDEFLLDLVVGARGGRHRGRAVPSRVRTRPVRGLDRRPRPARRRRRSRVRPHADAVRSPPPRPRCELRPDRRSPERSETAATPT